MFMVKNFITYQKKLPFSKAVIHNLKYTMEISGQIGINSETGIIVEGIEKQLITTLDNINKILKEVGWTFENIIKTRIYLINMSDYKIVNEIYKKYFDDNYPTRVVISVKQLPLDTLVEIECVAAGDKIK